MAAPLDVVIRFLRSENEKAAVIRCRRKNSMRTRGCCVAGGTESLKTGVKTDDAARSDKPHTANTPDTNINVERANDGQQSAAELKICYGSAHNTIHDVLQSL